MASAGATYEEVQEPRDGEETQPPRGDLCCDGNEDGDTGEDDVGVRHVRGRGRGRKGKVENCGRGRAQKSKVGNCGRRREQQSAVKNRGREGKNSAVENRGSGGDGDGVILSSVVMVTVLAMWSMVVVMLRASFRFCDVVEEERKRARSKN